jgi:vacuolar protein sorting-associated protein 26
MFSWLFGGRNPLTADDQGASALSVTFDPRPQNEQFRLPYFFPGGEIFIQTDSVSGVCRVDSRQPITHQGLNATLLGQVRVESDRSLNPFHTETCQIAPPGDLLPDSTIPFKISLAKVQVPSFYGTYYTVRWLVQIRSPKASARIEKECPIYILFVESRTREVWPPLATRIDISGVLIVEFHISQPYIDVGSCLLGLVVFELVRIRIREIKFVIQREEEFNNGIISSKMTALVLDFGVLDGGAVRGDIIPLRIFLAGIKLWPYPHKPSAPLHVKYTVAFVAVDDTGKEYQRRLSNDLLRLPSAK